MSNIFWPPYWTDLLYCRFHNKTISISLPQSFGPLWRIVLRIGYTELDEIEIEMIIAIRGFQGLRCCFTMYRLNLPLRQAKYTKIYCLCNNAGIMARPDEATVDGYDTQMQTNHLSHFLLLLGPSCWHRFCWIQKNGWKVMVQFELKNMKKWYFHGCFWDKQMEFVQWCHWCHWALVHPMAQSLEGSWEKWVDMVGISDISYIYIIVYIYMYVRMFACMHACMLMLMLVLMLSNVIWCNVM